MRGLQDDYESDSPVNESDRDGVRTLQFISSVMRGTILGDSIRLCRSVPQRDITEAAILPMNGEVIKELEDKTCSVCMDEIKEEQ